VRDIGIELGAKVFFACPLPSPQEAAQRQAKKLAALESLHQVEAVGAGKGGCGVDDRPEVLRALAAGCPSVKRLTAYGEPVEGTPFGRYRLIELLSRKRARRRLP
jgi:hypothetical protein